MQAIRADYPTDWPHANVYVLADLHLGAPTVTMRRCRQGWMPSSLTRMGFAS